MRRRLRTATLAALAAAALVVIPVAQAQAVTGCNVYHTYASDGRAYIDVWNETGQSVRLWRGGDTGDSPTVFGRVQKFRIKPYCDGRSQYSPPGAYPYRGGVTYAMSRSGLNLSITTTCLT